MKFIINLLVSGVAILIASFLTPNVVLSWGLMSAIWVAVLLGVVNAIVGNLLRFITAPLNFFTLGLVSFLISVVMVMLVDRFIDWFDIGGFGNAIIFSIVLGIINGIFWFLWLKK